MKNTFRVLNFISRLNLLGLIVGFLVLLGVPGLAARQADSFDAPLKKKVVDFGQSPYSKVRIKLSCYFYSSFMVKEYDEGQKGAEWLAIVPIKQGAAPACARSHEFGERVIEGAEWSGYFKGAKGNLVFFDGDDGYNGGMPFVVFDARTGTRLFDDSYFEVGMWKGEVDGSPFNRLRVSNAPDGQAFLTYLRVVEAGCDLNKDKGSCWEQVRKKFELKNAQAPVCSRYEGITDRCLSVIAYPVEVSLFPQPTTKTVDGPVKCWPVD
jgi:hypothetical protein